jgi:hypothetical protein
MNNEIAPRALTTSLPGPAAKVWAGELQLFKSTGVTMIDTSRRSLKKAVPDLLPSTEANSGSLSAFVKVKAVVPALTGQQTNEGAIKNPVPAIGEQHDIDPS